MDDGARLVESMMDKPYWWEIDTPAVKAPEGIESHYDVAILGGGYTGLCAARRLAKAGASVAVFEADRLGHGASTRNGGMVSGALKVSPTALARRVGTETCKAVFSEAQASVLHVEQLIDEEGIECTYARSGMFYAAYTPKHLSAMHATQREYADVGVHTQVLSRQASLGELNSDYYHGGKVLEMAGGLHPAAFHSGLARAAARHGASLFEQARVSGLERQSGQWRLTTARGSVRANQVLVATNGYTRGGPSPFAPRLIPVRSYVIATESLPQGMVKELIPAGRMIQDTKNLLYYFRPSPDGTRIIFGGRVSFVEIDPEKSARRLMRGLREIFPRAMQRVAVSHSWSGTVAFTFDALPHMGCDDGLHYAMGYCGQGVALSTYLGDRAAQAILEPASQTSVFQELPFRGKLGYTGNPWMLPAVSLGFQAKDYVNRHLLG